MLMFKLCILHLYDRIYNKGLCINSALFENKTYAFSLIMDIKESHIELNHKEQIKTIYYPEPKTLVKNFQGQPRKRLTYFFLSPSPSLSSLSPTPSPPPLSIATAALLPLSLFRQPQTQPMSIQASAYQQKADSPQLLHEAVALLFWETIGRISEEKVEESKRS